MTNMRVPFWGLLQLFAVLLAPSEAWEASTSQNLSITVTANTPSNAFYVAPNGKDSNPGTLASPFATLQACQAAMRNSSSIKTCYIRAGTYTGSGVGYNTQSLPGDGYTLQASLALTSADNGETYTEYPSDFPLNGISSAIFDGGAATWTTTGSASCPAASPPYSVMDHGIVISGGSNITIDRLQIRNYCIAAVLLQGGPNNRDDACANQAPASNSNGNTISNLYMANFSNYNSNCGAGAYVGALHSVGTNTNLTITHNVLFNTTSRGISVQVNPCGTGRTSESINGLMISYNVVYDVAYQVTDTGAFDLQDCAGIAEAKTIKYNFVANFGPKGQPQVINAFYNDDGISDMTRFGNVAVSTGDTCYFTHGPRNTAPNLDYGNICDTVNTAVAETRGGYWVSSASETNPPTSFAATWQQNLVIGNTASCASGVCAIQVNWSSPAGTTTFPGAGSNNNDYYNYGSGGTTLLQSEATGQGDTNGGATAPAFTCNVSGTNSWTYVLASNSPLYTAPFNFPQQPSGWGTPGFWGPPGYVIPHVSQIPSYIGSGVNGC